MQIYLFRAALVFLYACSSAVPQISLQETDKMDISGDWKFVRAELVDNPPALVPEDPFRPIVDEIALNTPPYIGPDLHIEGDSLYLLDYPKSVVMRTNFLLDSGYLLSSAGKFDARRYPFEQKNDTLYLYKPFDGEIFVKESYAKTKLNDSILHILKTQGVNYPELAGTWSLIRDMGVDDGSQYILKFPFKIPDSISLSRADMIKVTESKMVYWMYTNGKKRDYLLSYNWGYLCLTPGKWYRGDDPWIHYKKSE